MSEALVSPVDCCYPCPDTRSVSIPGPRGYPGAPGTDGTDGVNAFTQLAVAFEMPDYGDTDDATVDDASWMTVGEPVFVEGLGTLEVTAISGNVVTLRNLADAPGGQYAENAIPTTLANIDNYVTPTGWQGTPGSNAAAGAPSDAKYIIQEANAGLSGAQSLGLIAGGTGLLKNNVSGAVGTLTKATDGTDYLSPSTGLRPSNIGSTVQAYDALLTAIGVLGITVDKIIYGTGVDTVALATLSTFMRNLLASANAAAACTSLGVLERYGLLGGLLGGSHGTQPAIRQSR